jgi:hypothetical protein
MQTKYYMKDEVPFSDFSVYPEKSGRGGKAVTIFLVALFLIGGVVGGLYFLGRSRSSAPSAVSVPTQNPSPTELPSPTASISGTLTPTVAADLERAELSVAVLNGSGVRGAANATAATLRSLGYAVGATGNAENFTYTGITILIKKTESNYAELLKKDLDAENATVTTDDTIATDAVVIVGR